MPPIRPLSVSSTPAAAAVSTPLGPPRAPDAHPSLQDTFERAMDARTRALRRAVANLEAAGSTSQALRAGARAGLAAGSYLGGAVGTAAGLLIGAALAPFFGAVHAGAAAGSAVGCAVGTVLGACTAGAVGLVAGAGAGAARFAVAGTPKPLPATVPGLDLQRYQGTWYEVARYDNAFQDPHEAARAVYSLRADGTVEVRNTALDPVTGRERAITGTARVGEQGDPARLEVSFVPFLQKYGVGAADYWVLDLEPGYRYAVVGDPTRSFLWVLSRTPVMEASTMEEIRARVAAQGFDPTRLQPTPPYPVAP